MKSIRITSTLVISVAICALAVPLASAAASTLPEAGRCVQVAVGSGAYRGSSCTKRETGTKGKYEWTPASVTEKLGFAGSGSEAKLASVGHPTIDCVTANVSGTYTGPKTATVTIEFQGCTNAAGQQCQSGQTKSEISTLPLSAELGFTKDEEVNGFLRIAVGLDLKPQSPLTYLALYECGSATETTRLEGSVIAGVRPIDTMTTLNNLSFHVTRAGAQLPESFAGAEKDTLTSTFMTGLESTSAPSTLSIPQYSGTNSAPLEIRAKES